MNYNQELPKDVEQKLDEYIERIGTIKWFKPAQLKRDIVDRQINMAIKAFGIEASIEYRCLKTPQDWGAARGAARGAAWGAARGAAWGAAWDAARGAAWDAAWGAADLLAGNTPDGKYAKDYPQGNFVCLVDIWEMGLYPVGVIDGKFICYVPDVPEADELIK